MADPVQHLIDNFQSLQGWWPVSVCVQAWLMGLISVQAFDYYTLYGEDSVWLKLTVGVTVLLNLVGCACDIHVLYWQAVLNFGDYATILGAPVSNYVALFLSPIIAGTVQTFFAIRAHRLHKNILIDVAIGLCIAGGVAGGLAVAVLGSTIASNVDNIALLLDWIIVFLSISAGTDIIISGLFVWKLREKKAGFNRNTDGVIRRLLRLSVGTAGVTALLAIGNLVAFVVNNRTSNAFLIFNLTLPRVYTITMIYALNARQSLRLIAAEGSSGHHGASDGGKGRPRWGGFNDVASNTQGIAVHLETFQVHDDRASEFGSPRDTKPRLASRV